MQKKILLIPFCVTSTNRIICKYILHSFVIMFKKLKLRRKNISLRGKVYIKTSKICI